MLESTNVRPFPRALGVFHAISTCDAQALEREGERYYAMNCMQSRGSEPIAEIMFRDSTWMLVNPGRDRVTL